MTAMVRCLGAVRRQVSGFGTGWGKQPAPSSNQQGQSGWGVLSVAATPADSLSSKGGRCLEEQE